MSQTIPHDQPEAQARDHQPEAQARDNHSESGNTANIRFLSTRFLSVSWSLRPSLSPSPLPLFFIATLLLCLSNIALLPAAQDPLAAKQQIVQDRMTQLEDRMFRLAEKLAETDPQQAQRLTEALRKAREALLRRNMAETITLLEQARLTEAADHMQEIGDGLEQLLKILLDDPDQQKRLQAELERLAAIRKQLDGLIDRQQQLKDRIEQNQAPADELAEIQAAIARLETLIDRQKKEIAKSAATTQPEKSAGLEESQKSLRQDTHTLADDFRQMGKTSASRPESQPITPSTDEAAKSTEQAAKHMQAAEQPLRDDQPEQARPHQEQALQALQQALEQMQKQQRAIREQIDLAKAAEEQKKLKNEADKLSEEMQGQDASPTDGAENVQKAGEHMDQAAKALDQEQSGQAAQNQQQALDQLKQARAELERILEQKRREQQEEILRGLESRFRVMLAEQIKVNQATQELESKGPPNWTREDELVLAGTAQNQLGLIEQAEQALRILKEEGTTIVFPRMVEQLGEDMRESHGRLQGKETGPETQRIQSEVVNTLKELIEAIQKLQEEGMPGGGEGGGQEAGKQPAPLLPGSAELKLLRSCQQRVNRDTEALKTKAANGELIDPRQQKDRARLADRQNELAEMAGKMHERITGR